MELISSKITKARKEHACDYCGKTIKVGEEYDYAKCVSEGYLYVWKACLQCLEFIDKFKIEGDDGIGPDYIQDAVNNEFSCRGLDKGDMEAYEQIAMLLDMMGA